MENTLKAFIVRRSALDRKLLAVAGPLVASVVVVAVSRLLKDHFLVIPCLLAVCIRLHAHAGALLDSRDISPAALVMCALGCTVPNIRYFQGCGDYVNFAFGCLSKEIIREGRSYPWVLLVQQFGLVEIVRLLRFCIILCAALISWRQGSAHNALVYYVGPGMVASFAFIGVAPVHTIPALKILSHLLCGLSLAPQIRLLTRAHAPSRNAVKFSLYCALAAILEASADALAVLLNGTDPLEAILFLISVSISYAVCMRCIVMYLASTRREFVTLEMLVG